MMIARNNHYSDLLSCYIIERFSVQESGDGADRDLPPWLVFTPHITVKAYTNSKDLDVCEQSYKLEGML